MAEIAKAMMEDENPFRAPESDTGGAIAGPMTDAERIRREYIGHETSVKSISALYFLGIVIALFSLSVPATILLSRDSPKRGPADVPEAFVWMIAAVGIATLFAFVGVGLHKLKRASWLPAIVISSLWALASLWSLRFPIGAIVNVYALYLLSCRKGRYVFSEEYREVIRQTPHVKYRTSPVMYVVLLILVLLIVGSVLAFVMSGRR